MCNGASKQGIPVTRVTYFPHGQFSSGGCGCCPGRKGLANSELATSIFTAERIGNATVVTAMASDFVATKLENGAQAYTPGPFLVDKCFGSTGTYTGNYDSCVNMCKGYARNFVTGSYTVSFFPWGQFSSGGCKCCGSVDPCFN